MWVVLGGCADALGPNAGVEGLAGLPLALPTAASLSDRIGDEAVGREWAAQWQDSWLAETEAGSGTRAELRRLVALELVDVDPTQERDRARELLGGLESLLGPEAEATRVLAPALESLRRSEQTSGSEAWESLLAASDRALTLDPELLTRGLLACAGRRERRKAETDSYTEQMIIRARHLQAGAREALQLDDPILAVRRAFYGCRLLAENGEDAERRE